MTEKISNSVTCQLDVNKNIINCTGAVKCNDYYLYYQERSDEYGIDYYILDNELNEVDGGEFCYGSYNEITEMYDIDNGTEAVTFKELFDYINEDDNFNFDESGIEITDQDVIDDIWSATCGDTIDVDSINDKINNAMELANRIENVNKASKVINEAVELGILVEDPNNSQNIYVYMVFDNGKEGFVSRNKLEAAIDLADQGKIEMLAKAVKGAKENKKISKDEKEISNETER